MPWADKSHGGAEARLCHRKFASSERAVEITHDALDRAFSSRVTKRRNVKSAKIDCSSKSGVSTTINRFWSHLQLSIGECGEVCADGSLLVVPLLPVTSGWSCWSRTDRDCLHNPSHLTPHVFGASYQCASAPQRPDPKATSRPSVDGDDDASRRRSSGSIAAGWSVVRESKRERDREKRGGCTRVRRSQTQPQRQQIGRSRTREDDNDTKRQTADGGGAGRERLRARARKRESPSRRAQRKGHQNGGKTEREPADDR